MRRGAETDGVRDEVQCLVEWSRFFHECAHFVIARHFGLEATISMTPAAGAPKHWGAHCSHESGSNKQNAMIRLAGEVIEEILDSKLAELGAKVVREGVGADGLTDDAKHAMFWCLQETGGDIASATELVNRLFAEATRLAFEHWEEIAVEARAQKYLAREVGNVRVGEPQIERCHQDGRQRIRMTPEASPVCAVRRPMFEQKTLTRPLPHGAKFFRKKVA